jgi:hypothetical protein
MKGHVNKLPELTQLLTSSARSSASALSEAMSAMEEASLDISSLAMVNSFCFESAKRSGLVAF